ncbi:hypothetical protein JVT61DRAFT_9924 [Boletus reticuloceps]|uniref:Uncharacterized protein n=1 Tax=Boletus reticuloceps TaxID=495285 RepID=A0A8I2YFZ1_9AGAM|nr:hypothetical protein JVT61DRAFT_9924 [Boletus reticuloceps]
MGRILHFLWEHEGKIIFVFDSVPLWDGETISFSHHDAFQIERNGSLVGFMQMLGASGNGYHVPSGWFIWAERRINLVFETMRVVSEVAASLGASANNRLAGGQLLITPKNLTPKQQESFVPALRSALSAPSIPLSDMGMYAMDQEGDEIVVKFEIKEAIKRVSSKCVLVHFEPDADEVIEDGMALTLPTYYSDVLPLIYRN